MMIDEVGDDVWLVNGDAAGLQPSYRDVKRWHKGRSQHG
jgi:hypothetical protein